MTEKQMLRFALGLMGAGFSGGVLVGLAIEKLLRRLKAYAKKYVRERRMTF